MFDQTSKVFIFNICSFYTTLFVFMLVSISYFTALIHDLQNVGRPPSWIFIFSQYLGKIQICAYIYVDMQNLAKIGRPAADYCVFSILKMAAVRHFGFGMTS